MKNIYKNIRNALVLSIMLLPASINKLLELFEIYKLYDGHIFNLTSFCVDLLICVAIIILSFWTLYRSIIWKNNKNIRAYINRQSSPTIALEKINHHLRNAPTIKGMQYDSDFISGRNFFGLEFIEVKNIKSIRKLVKRHSINFIPVVKNNYLEFTLNDESVVSLSFFSEHGVDQAINTLKNQHLI